MDELNTHNIKLNFGRHKDELVTRLPISYLHWMVNEKAPMAEYAMSELKRRKTKLPKIEISVHAIDRASFKLIRHWEKTRETGEGLHSWLERITLMAISNGHLKDEKIIFQGIGFVVHKGEEFPVLKTVTVEKERCGG